MGIHADIVTDTLRWQYCDAMPHTVFRNPCFSIVKDPKWGAEATPYETGPHGIGTIASFDSSHPGSATC
jgi:hypothetical protein